MEAPTASVAGSRLSVVVHALNLVFLVLLAVAAGFGIRAVLLVQNIVPIHNLSDPETGEFPRPGAAHARARAEAACAASPVSARR
jgi:hypothetical protein